MGTSADAVCQRCSGNIIEDRREDRRYCLLCGFEPLTEYEALRQQLAIEAMLARPPAKRHRSARSNGMNLD